MTPKERAKYLFDKMKGFRVKHSHSKKCAKIAVEEMLNQFKGLSKPEYVAFDCIGERQFTYEGEYADRMTGYDMVAYWQEVLKEIDLL